MREIVLVHIDGDDQTGLMAAIMGVLARYEVNVLDLGQAVIHKSLSLGVLMEIPPAAETAPIIKDLVYKAHELGVRLKCEPIAEADYDAWVHAQGKKRHIVTLLSRTITAQQIAAIAGLMSDMGLNIDVATRLTGRPRLDQPEREKRACMEFSVRGEPADMTRLKSEILRISADLDVDVAFQEDTMFRRNRRLVAFDMDSTLIQAEVVDELARAAGKYEEVAAVTEAAMRGEMDFKESLRRRLMLLRGLPESKMHEVAESIPLTEGAERLIANLKNLGYAIAIISGGFTWFGRRLGERLGIDYVYANELEIEDGVLTGEVVGRIVDAERKAEILREIADAEGIRLEQVIAVGDGANDLPMLNVAGLGIAFHAKPIVREGAEQAISTLGLDGILYLIGVRDRDTIGDPRSVTNL
jgi:phosphoserine phosphatase